MDRIVMATGEWPDFAGIDVDPALRLTVHRVVRDDAAKARTAEIDAHATAEDRVVENAYPREALDGNVDAEIEFVEADRDYGEATDGDPGRGDRENVSTHGWFDQRGSGSVRRRDRQIARPDHDVLSVGPGADPDDIARAGRVDRRLDGGVPRIGATRAGRRVAAGIVVHPAGCRGGGRVAAQQERERCRRQQGQTRRRSGAPGSAVPVYRCRVSRHGVLLPLM